MRIGRKLHIRATVGKCTFTRTWQSWKCPKRAPRFLRRARCLLAQMTLFNCPPLLVQQREILLACPFVD